MQSNKGEREWRNMTRKEKKKHREGRQIDTRAELQKEELSVLILTLNSKSPYMLTGVINIAFTLPD